jgi:hypothetical protein
MATGRWLAVFPFILVFNSPMLSGPLYYQLLYLLLKIVLKEIMEEDSIVY